MSGRRIELGKGMRLAVVTAFVVAAGAGGTANAYVGATSAAPSGATFLDSAGQSCVAQVSGTDSSSTNNVHGAASLQCVGSYAYGFVTAQVCTASPTDAVVPSRACTNGSTVETLDGVANAEVTAFGPALETYTASAYLDLRSVVGVWQQYPTGCQLQNGGANLYCPPGVVQSAGGFTGVATPNSR